MVPLKVLVLPRYAKLGASSRLRFEQYFPYLESHGISVVAAPLLDDAYLRQLYGKQGRSPWHLLVRYIGRLRELTAAGQFDLVWLEKEFLPWLPGGVEAWLARHLPPLAIDYDDAIFHNYDRHASPLVRHLLGGKIARLVRQSALVVAGNPYLADYAQRAGAPAVTILPTVIDLERYPETGVERSEEFRVGWIGSPSTVHYLESVLPALAAVARELPLRLVLVGGKLPGRQPFAVTELPWSESTEVRDIGSFDVGIMPLPDEAWERGKCGYKLVQYMACSKPIIASPVGINQEIVTEGEDCGLLAGDTLSWTQALRTLAGDVKLCRRLGQAGRRKVEARYCVQATAPLLLASLRRAAFESSRRSVPG
ncbi:MAG: glycosyltransferase family 4 protein [Rhodocyclaceae bacterium]|nr:glycosyltransferase family 4 protein [Rhodocyclaceae bacterium]